MQTRPQFAPSLTPRQSESPRLLKRPGSIIVAALTLSLAIGAMALILALAKGVLFSSLPYPDADRLVELWETDSRRGMDDDYIAYANYADWRDRNTAFEEMAVYATPSVNLSGVGEPRFSLSTRRSTSGRSR